MGSLVQMGLTNALLAGMLAVVALIAQRYSRRPALAHTLWVLVLIKLVTPPLVSLPVPGWRAAEPALVAEPAPKKREAAPRPAPAPAPAVEETPDGPLVLRIEDLALNPAPARPAEPRIVPPPVAPPPSAVASESEPAAPRQSAPATAAVISTGPDLLAMAGWLWLMGAFGVLLLTLWRIERFKSLLSYARRAPGALQRQAETLAERLGLSECPDVLLLPGPVPPMLWAVGGQARLYFPSSLLARLDERGRAALLMHELAHLRRRDHWVRWLELVAGVLFWWYPVLWLARHRLQIAEEECCDAWVTSELPDHRSAYAGALLETIDFLSQVPSPFPPAASGFGRVYQLKRRLTMIIRGSTPRGLSLAGKLGVFALALALPLVPGRSAAPPTAEAKAQAKTDSTRPMEGVSPEMGSGDEPAQYQTTPRPFGSGGGGQVWQARVSPDGKTLAVVAGGTGQNEGALTLYDLPDGKERVTRTEPKPIRCVVFSPDGKHLATGDFDNKTQLRDPKTGEVKKVLQGHTASVNSLVFSHDNKHLITASLDKTLKVWDVATGKELHTLTGHTDWVLNVAMSPDGKTLVSASKDTTARVWDVPAYKLRHELKGHTNWVEACACSPDNKTVATFGLENTVKLWDATTGAHLRDLAGHTSGVLAGVFLDSKTLVTGSHDRNLIFWDVGTGTATHTIESGHTSGTYAITATPNSKMIVSGSWDKAVKLWDVDSHEEKKVLRTRRYLDENNFPLLAMACSPDGKYLACGGEEKAVKLLDASTGGFVHLLEGHEDIVGGIAFSRDSKTLATAGFDGFVILWDVASGKKKEVLKGHDNWVFGVAFSPDGKYLASAGYDRSVRIWDAKTGKPISVLGQGKGGHKGGVRAVAWSPDSKRVATGGTDKAVRVWDVEKKELLHTLKGHEDAIRGVVFSPDDRRVYSASEDQTVRMWNLADEKQAGIHNHQNVIRGIALSPRGRSLTVVAQDGSARVLDPNSLGQRMTVFGHQNGGATCVAYSPDARSLYTGGADRAIRRYEAAVDARGPLLTFRGDPKQQMWVANYSPDGKFLVTAGADKMLRVRPSMSGTRPWSLQGLDSAVYGMAVSPDGETLATGNFDGTVKLWNLKTGTKKGQLEGLKNQVWMMAFSPDGKKVAAGSGQWGESSLPGYGKVWDISGKEPKEIGDLPDLGAQLMAVAWSKDGKHIVIGARDGTAKLLDASTLKEKFSLEGHKDAARFAVFSPDDKYVATASFDKTVKVWSVATGKEVASLTAHERGANCVAWSRDGKLLASCSRPGGETPGPGEVRLWDVTMSDDAAPTFKERALLKGHTQNVLCCGFSPDSKTLASVGGLYGQFGEAIVWDVATNKERMQLHGHRMWCEGMTWSKDGSVLFTGGGTANSRGEVRAWLMTPGGWEVANAHKGQICCSAWNKEGTLLATGCTNSGLKIWDVATGKLKQELAGHKKGMMRSLAFSPDGKTLVSSADDGMVKLWDLDGVTEPIELTKHRLNVTSVSFSPDGKWLATGSADPSYQDRTGDLKVFEVKTGKERTGMQWVNQPALSVAYSPDGKYLAAASAGPNSLRIYDSNSGKLLRTVTGANSIRVLAWSPDSKRVATGHGSGGLRGNGSVQIWDANTGRELMALTGHTSLCLGIGYSHDGQRLASASNDGTVKVWDLVGPAIPAATARAAPPRPKE